VIFWVRRSIRIKLKPNLALLSERIAFAIHSNHLDIRSMTTTKVPMSIRLDANARERLKAIAAREYAWHQSCDGALKHFDETGLHATHEEVMAWMGTWGTDRESPASVCHP
jgi:predicted transcriptional regulator